MELNLALGRLLFGKILDGVENGSIGMFEGDVVSNI